MRPARRLFTAMVSVAVLSSAWAVAPAPVSAQVPPLPVGLPCDPLDPAHCLLPFPNDRFTTADPSTGTGRRVDLLPVEMPRSIAGKPIDPTEWNRNDGFSPGSDILTFVPGLDLHRTWGTHTLAAPGVGGPNDPRDHVADIARFKAPNAPILIIDAQTGKRWPFWSELDTNAETGDDERLLILRPAGNFLEGHRYLVALRNLKDEAGNTIPAAPQFAAYRDGKPGPAGPTFEESRRAEVNGIIEEIARAERSSNTGPFNRSDLYLAWSFTVASQRNLSGRVLHMRDRAFAMLGDTNLADRKLQGSSPEFRITATTELTDSRKQRQVEGTIKVPNFLDGQPLPIGPEEVEVPEIGGLPMQALLGRRLLYGKNGKPMQNRALPFIDVPFVCTIPRAATALNRAHPMLYGHGLLGSRFESAGGSTDRDRERNFMPCAMNWMGFAEYDVGNALLTLLDPSNMPTMADRAQQGFLNFLYLGRALAHPAGLSTVAAFKNAVARPLFQPGELFYDGNSQGGIMGGALIALSVDLTRGVLGVPGMNYSTLLNRSVDWEGPLINPDFPGDPLPSYASFLYTMFPDKKEQQVVMALLQMLWDRAEGNGYAQHMTIDPLPNTPAHQVLMHVALGDFQVTNQAAEVQARTIRARAMDTALAPGRHWSADPDWWFSMEPFRRDEQGAILPHRGSALVYWDSGNLLPPNGNVPPAEDGGDPHEDPRRDRRAGDQKAAFWLTGMVIDVMNGGPYLLCRPGAENSIPRVPSQFTTDWCLPGA
ncbi:MAG: hypothetical protein WD770_05170 [Actinomycetota bacterium]